jgi:ComF family protein
MCPACNQRNFAFDSVRSWGRYSAELRRAILTLKHRRNDALGGALSKGLLDIMRAQDWKLDAVPPIPLAPHRLAKRGFNQVDLFAQPLAAAVGVEWLPRALGRARETDPQMDLTLAERWENVQRAFIASPQQVGGLNLLVIDDIMTTGATLNAAASALKHAGAKRVYGLTLARALLDDVPLLR